MTAAVALELREISGPRAAETAGGLADTYEEVPTMAQRTRRKVDPLVRLMARVVKEDGCWVWTGKPTSKGYSTIGVNGRPYPGHRLAYEREHGPLDPGLVLHHECRNRLCVNPGHLTPLTNEAHGALHNSAAGACLRCGSTDFYVHPASGRRKCRQCQRRRKAAREQRLRDAAPPLNDAAAIRRRRAAVKGARSRWEPVFPGRFERERAVLAEYDRSTQ